MNSKMNTRGSNEKMNNMVIKKLRKQYRDKINGIATRDLRKTIFRLARQRDILGIILIAESIVVVMLLFNLIAP
jgi:hypothetical protein